MNHIKNKKLIEKNNIELIVYDFDGVMTDNKLFTFADGREAVIVNRSDGLAVSKIKKSGIGQIIISTETNSVVKSRAAKLDIPVLYGISNKKNTLLNFCKENSYRLAKTVYIGNDINDLEAMRIVGYPFCPLDAHESIKQVSKWVIQKKGGEGVIRNFWDIVNWKGENE